MGGLFSEGIDLTGNRLIGVIVVGTGLPMVCTEQKIFAGIFLKKREKMDLHMPTSIQA